ncbi:unnamed protein product [Sympodiomycopsis kandeliae]
MNAPMPRQSIFPGSGGPQFTSGPISTSHLTSLQASIQSLEHSVNVLGHTNAMLSESVADVPRLNTVLMSKRHFDVVSASQVSEAKKQLEDEVRPHLKELLKRGEQEVERESALARRSKNKVSQLTTRLEQVLSTQGFNLSDATPSKSKTSSNALSVERAAVQEEEKRIADLERVRKRRLQLEEELQILEEQVEREEMEAQLLRNQDKRMDRPSR